MCDFSFTLAYLKLLHTRVVEFYEQTGFWIREQGRLGKTACSRDPPSYVAAIGRVKTRFFLFRKLWVQQLPAPKSSACTLASSNLAEIASAQCMIPFLRICITILPLF
jgi:hypothetical protein